MIASSVQKLCRELISSAIHRCRMSDDLCRLSVFLKSFPLSNPPRVRISVSDTGVGSCLEEFQDLKYWRDPIMTETWDGVISVATTSISDDEIYHYNLDLKESISTRRLTKLPPDAKNGVKFSGTEVLLSTLENIDYLQADVICFLQKMLILKIPKVAIELVVDHGDPPGSKCVKIILANQCVPSSLLSNIECLKSGLEDYVLKHGNCLDNICHSCFSQGEQLKVGGGVACCKGRSRNAGQVMEAVIIISESPESLSPPCFRAHGTKTEVLCFKDFLPCSISSSSLNALISIDWKSYGLTLRSISDQDEYALIEWDNLPSNFHIDIILHRYHKQIVMPPAKLKAQLDRTLARKAVKLALDDLKEKYAGALLTAQALKIRSYAPDLARTIAGLILSSNASNFRGECMSLLGLKSQETETETIENCIREKIFSVIELNDRKPQRSREAAPFLFEDDCYKEPNFLDDYEESEEASSSLDL